MSATALLTSERYLALPVEFDEHGNRVKNELSGIEILKMPTPSRVHDPISNRISNSIRRFLDRRVELVFVSLLEIAGFSTRVSVSFDLT